MASEVGRVGLRVVVVILVCVVAFYVGRPLYWKLSATLHDVRQKNYDPQAMKDGISQLVHSAQNAVGWVNDESDAGVGHKPIKKSMKKVDKTRRANLRRLAYL